ncbi:MAG: CBS domain-containing protein [Planctomycetota bacterium]
MDFELSLQSETVQSAYPQPPREVPPDWSVSRVIRKMREEKTGMLLVVEGGRLRGVFTERDAVQMLASGADLNGPVAASMTPAPVGVGPRAAVGEAIEKMARGGYRHLPVLDGQTPVGIVATKGVVHYLVDHFPDTIYNLPPDPSEPAGDREGA